MVLLNDRGGRPAACMGSLGCGTAANRRGTSLIPLLHALADSDLLWLFAENVGAQLMTPFISFLLRTT